ncbi:EFR1 family ferrodoxin [Pelotomaculum terephthalicicum JT]|uniref:EFR1 family ferrodoxin n=1 Tax=Pelotomaculum TaxID=191373 RepID=UPI0009D13707|nr:MULTISPECIES: EFR1 family ferrodoxin [Pelotomaculum]MCG9968884.1 EFR1 family ferrodoxin [Pelotomaculum terephthalicicum JT]OPX87450.1 MAG: NADH-plastoquinone oxidoreductase subunit [Pelotomaculum sp. PtaB.Bin117]OPY61585.1 MAG: NADH-plastoquinone oxidoreductase subunit [Pelotomaculum sp. PtaU1.Bin065]
MEKINAMYFSPTGTTQKIVSGLAGKILENAGGQTAVNIIDFTLPGVRKETVSFTAEDLVVIGVPVYAGRVPNILLKYMNSITGNGALAVAVVLYGNRDYDDALIELKDILELNGFKVIAGGAFIGEHSISKILAKNRPDEKDMAVINDFASKIYAKITTGNNLQSVMVKGNKPYRKYYMPIDEHGMPVDFRKFVPKTSSDCMDCKLCPSICPVGSINYEDVSKLDGICIKCGACVKNCPNEAKYFDDKDFLRHKHELEVEFAERKEPELFL